MTRIIILLTAIFLSLASGTAQPQRIISPYGQTAYIVECKRTTNDCLHQAGNLCGSQGYIVLHTDSHAGGILADWLPGPITWYNLTIQCR